MRNSYEAITHTNPSKELLEDGNFAVKEIQATEDAQEVAEHWEKEVKALRMMNRLNQEHIVRFITAFRRRMENGQVDHYLMFEWADRGNLRTLWKTTPFSALTATLIKDFTRQLMGLSRALEAAHNLSHRGTSYRHGDLKPENILVVSGGGSFGTLKIGDWGEAKIHNEVTEMRPSKTTAKYGTRRYEAPEVETGVRPKFLGQSTKRRSRLYDIWAMGCITLEFLIWLLYGPDDLKKFNQELGEDNFYKVSIVNGKKVAEVHHAAVRWMNHMAQEPGCEVGRTALGDILELVRTAMLVVKLPRRLGTNLPETEKSRMDSVVMDDASTTNNNDEDIAQPPNIPPQYVGPLIDIPAISVTLADPEPERIPVQP